VRVSAIGRVGCADGCPIVTAGIISPAGVQISAVISAPDDHFTTGPHRSVNFPASGRVSEAGSCPTVGGRMISAASVKISANINPAPDDHFAAGPHCCVIRSPSRRVGEAGWSPPVVGARRRRLRAVSPAGVQRDSTVLSAPDDHLAAGPHCRVSVSGIGRVGGAGGCPTVGAGGVSPTRVKIAAIKAAPDNHFAAGPHCRVSVSAGGRAGGAGGCPTIGAGIVSPA
jgi:hypothetical protein